jgi:hypothetical protein
MIYGLDVFFLLFDFDFFLDDLAVGFEKLHGFHSAWTRTPVRYPREFFFSKFFQFFLSLDALALRDCACIRYIGVISRMVDCTTWYALSETSSHSILRT